MTMLLMSLTPCLDPKYEPIADNGAEIPNHKSAMSNIVPVTIDE